MRTEAYPVTVTRAELDAHRSPLLERMLDEQRQRIGDLIEHDLLRGFEQDEERRQRCAAYATRRTELLRDAEARLAQGERVDINAVQREFLDLVDQEEANKVQPWSLRGCL